MQEQSQEIQVAMAVLQKQRNDALDSMANTQIELEMLKQKFNEAQDKIKEIEGAQANVPETNED